VDPKRAGSDQGSFDAVGAALPQYVVHRKARLPADLVVRWNRVDEQLHLLRRAEPSQNRELVRRKTKIFATGEPTVHQRSHAGR